METDPHLLRFAYSTINWGTTPDLESVFGEIREAGWGAVELFVHQLDWLGTPDHLRSALGALEVATNFGVVEVPTNKDQLTKVLTYHVVPGRLTAKDLMAAAAKGGGKAIYKTVEGEELTIQIKDGEIWVWDAKGGSAKITIKNVMQSNGVIHVIDTVLLPS